MIHIIDVKETLKGLLIAKKLLADVVSSGKDVVFVGTKRQAQKAVTEAAQKCAMHSVSERWLGGMLTNFRTVRSRLQRLEELEKMEADGKLAAESKKQESRMKREMRKIKTNLGGVRKMGKLPGAVVVVDVKKELTALREAKKLGIVTIGIIDTDSNPDNVDVAIPANDDSIKAIDILLGELVHAVALGKTIVKPAGVTPGPARGRSRRRALATASDEPGAPATPPAVPAVPAVPVAPVAPVPAVPVTSEAKPAEKPAEAEPVAVESAKTVETPPATTDAGAETSSEPQGE
jgi:small subunit ribosomal protein S2